MGQEGRLQLPWKRLIGSASQAMGGSMGVPPHPPSFPSVITTPRWRTGGKHADTCYFVSMASSLQPPETRGAKMVWSFQDTVVEIPPMTAQRQGPKGDRRRRPSS